MGLRCQPFLFETTPILSDTLRRIMTRHFLLFFCLIMTANTVFAETQTRRIFLPSRFSHDAETGDQLIQHTPRPEPLQPNDPTYVKAGFTWNRYVERNHNGTAAVHVQLESWGYPYWPYYHPYNSQTPYRSWHGHPGWR